MRKKATTNHNQSCEKAGTLTDEEVIRDLIRIGHKGRMSNALRELYNNPTLENLINCINRSEKDLEILINKHNKSADIIYKLCHNKKRFTKGAKEVQFTLKPIGSSIDPGENIGFNLLEPVEIGSINYNKVTPFVVKDLAFVRAVDGDEYFVEPDEVRFFLEALFRRVGCIEKQGLKVSIHGFGNFLAKHSPCKILGGRIEELALFKHGKRAYHSEDPVFRKMKETFEGIGQLDANDPQTKNVMLLYCLTEM